MNNSNKYGSLLNTLYGMDMYNLVMPVLPPADIAISGSLMAPAYLSYRNGSAGRAIDFDLNDNPYFRAFGITSNMADGLVDAASGHSGAGNGWEITITPHRVGASQTGTIANTAGSATVTGTGTFFTRGLAPGATITWYDSNKVLRFGVIASIASDTSLTLTAVTASTGMFTGNSSGASFNLLTGVAGYLGDPRTMPVFMLNALHPCAFFAAEAYLLDNTISGLITVQSGATTVNGSGTAFESDLEVGQVFGWTDNTGIDRTGVVQSITSDTALELTSAAYATASNKSASNLDSTIRVLTQFTSDGFNAYTIAIDPTFSTKRLSISTYAEMEHTFEMSGNL